MIFIKLQITILYQLCMKSYSLNLLFLQKEFKKIMNENMKFTLTNV